MNKSFVESVLLFYAFSAKCQSSSSSYISRYSNRSSRSVQNCGWVWVSSQFLSVPVSFCYLSRVVKILEKNFSKSFETASLFILWKSGLAELVSTKENVSKFSIFLLAVAFWFFRCSKWKSLYSCTLYSLNEFLHLSSVKLNITNFFIYICCCRAGTRKSIVCQSNWWVLERKVSWQTIFFITESPLLLG